ncbi:hypothetical protein Moror_7574 [Moniliophthora roreri MCA 2997]|uniref:Uncharacterized protein n=1 Tax=Moniliophthora roreri (strain MCA 2997) TaxID=1381753 RepID=V2XWX7_MONRO|nr:hypothetical protein Moror_7574 [Moniliophthora roreri MCA 2997]
MARYPRSPSTQSNGVSSPAFGQKMYHYRSLWLRNLKSGFRRRLPLLRVYSCHLLLRKQALTSRLHQVSQSEDGTPSSIHFTEEEGSTASVEPPTTSVPRTEYPSEPSSSSISASAPSSSPSASALQLPTTVPSTSLTLFGLTVTTESSLTPTIPPTIDESSSPSSRSPGIPPSPTPWASEPNSSYEPSQLEPSPSIRSIALHEGPVISFKASFLRPTASYSSLDRMSTISPTLTASSSALPQRLPPPPSLDLGSEVSIPSSLMFSESSQLAGSSSVRSTTSVSSGMSQTSITSSILDSSSVIDEMEEEEREESMRMSEVSTEPSLLTTPQNT